MAVSLDPELLDETPWIAVCVAVQVLLMARIAVLAVAHRQDVKGFLGSMESILASMNCRRTSTDVQEDRLLEAKVTEMRLRLSHKLNIVTLLWWFIICVSLELNMLADSPRWMSATLSWLCLAMLCWHGLPFVFPCMLRRSTVGWWYTISMALAALIESPLCTTMDQSNHMAIMLIALARLPGSVYVSPWLAILCNAALSAQTQWRLQREEQSIAGCPCADVRQKNLMAVSLTFLTVIVSALVVNRSLRNHVRQNIIISKAAKELSAASSLLDLTCDAVLELDDDLTLKAHSKDLASMLLRDHPNSSLEGMKFTDLMPTPEEAARTEEILKGQSEEGSPKRDNIFTKAFHTRLVDSCSSKFRTEVFHVKYTRMDNVCCHLVGLRDFTDQESLARNAMDSSEDRVRPVRFARSDIPHPPLERPSDQQPNRGVFMHFNMEQKQIDATSLQTSFFAGKLLEDIFGASELEFLKQVWEQVQLLESRGELENKELNFVNLELLWSSSHAVLVSGGIEVTKLADGKMGFLLHFQPPDLPCSYPFLRGTPSSRSSSRSSQSSRGRSKASKAKPAKPAAAAGTTARKERYSL